MLKHNPRLGRATSPLARFDDRGRPEGCWDWTGARNHEGYGRYKQGGRQIRAHRLFYERYVGPIPPDKEIDHLCRNRACVNPDHLEAVTKAENARRGIQARLTADQVRELRDLWDRRVLTQRQLAERYGVHWNTVQKVIYRQSWRDL